jgi:hypothetical protein
LIEFPNDPLAVYAAITAIADLDVDCAETIAGRIAKWHPREQAAILQRPHVNSFMQVPRTLARTTVEDPTQAMADDPSPDFAAAAPAGLAAILLSTGQDKSDSQLILDLAEVRPRLWGVWMAVAHTGILDGRRARVAAAVYRDPTVPLPVRVAAASALGRADPRAAAFAADQVDSFLARFADLDLPSMLRAARAATPESDAYRQYWRLILDFHMAATLLVLDDYAAAPLATRFLKANNQDVRNLCGIVVARRWPDQLMKSGRGAFSEREFGALLALIAQNHPEQTTAAAALVPDGLAKASSDLRTLGLGALFNRPGNLLEMFLGDTQAGATTNSK